MIDVTVKVPEDRIADFYTMYGNWLAEQWEADEDALLVEWRPGDVEPATTLWRSLSDRARSLFTVLMDNPGRKFSGNELGTLLDAPHGRRSIAGLLGAPGKHCLSAGRELPWRWDYPDGETARYWMTAELAALFRQARDAVS
ncbi:DUF6416 domain-containing protein [Amycolatopsis samaneae]|uniref:DUF6416 domain-containing protein n=1 Tax=Amycolatopsis samaneae TaxID=664691 RepID=A0ABW5GMW4_9PSEU